MTASTGTTVDIANDTDEECKGYGRLDLLVKHSEE